MLKNLLNMFQNGMVNEIKKNYTDIDFTKSIYIKTYKFKFINSAYLAKQNISINTSSLFRVKKMYIFL